MKNIHKAILTISLTLATANFTYASGIPVVDGAALAQRQFEIAETIKAWTEEAKRWANTIQHYKSQLSAYADQLASQTGIRDLQAFINEANSLYGELNNLRNEFTPTFELLTGGKEVLKDQAKALFDKYNVFDRCKNLSIVEIKNCEANIVSTVQNISFLDSFERDVNKKLKAIDNIAKRISKSKDIKESQDLTNAMQVQLASLQAQKIQLDMYQAQQAEYRRIMNEQQKQLASQRRLNGKVPKLQ